jgi:hypothetical protein
MTVAIISWTKAYSESCYPDINMKEDSPKTAIGFLLSLTASLVRTILYKGVPP